jgi:hypothetical protein
MKPGPLARLRDYVIWCNEISLSQFSCHSISHVQECHVLKFNHSFDFRALSTYILPVLPLMTTATAINRIASTTSIAMTMMMTASILVDVEVGALLVRCPHT